MDIHSHAAALAKTKNTEDQSPQVLRMVTMFEHTCDVLRWASGCLDSLEGTVYTAATQQQRLYPRT